MSKFNETGRYKSIFRVKANVLIEIQRLNPWIFDTLFLELAKHKKVVNCVTSKFEIEVKRFTAE